MALVLARSASLGAVDEQRSWVGRQFVQLDLEWVGVVLDQACESIAVLLGCGSPAHFVPPCVTAGLPLLHAPEVSL
jgi:hypothetical protein